MQMGRIKALIFLQTVTNGIKYTFYGWKVGYKWAFPGQFLTGEDSKI